MPPSALWLAFILGVLFLAISTMNGARSLLLVVSGHRTLATIVDLQAAGDPKSVYPVFRFTDSMGVVRTAVSRVSVAAGQTDHGVGTRVAILVDRAHPDQAQENDLRRLWAVPLVTGVIGVGWLAAALILWKMRQATR